MTEVEVNVVEEQSEEKEPNPFLDMARKVLLASIGAVALAQEEIEEFVDRLVERGEIAEKDGRKLINDVLERRRKKAEEQAEEVGEEVDERIEEALHRMNVPTKTDIDALSQKITTLTKKVDELKKAQEA
jgi:poly(hydroxyalkanoate) granule-associated protein